MARLEFKTLKKKAVVNKLATKTYLNSKYFSLFMNHFEFEGLNEQQSRFLLTQFWEVGRILAFILPESKTKDIEGELILTPFSESGYKNIYNFPTGVIATNSKGATFIPTEIMQVNKDCVIGFAHSSHNAIRYLVDYYTDKITEVETCIEMNLASHKLPRLITCSPEDKERVKRIMDNIEEGVKNIFLDTEDYQAINNVLSSGENYIIDKLYNYKTSLENELLTLMGIDNKGINKAERLLVDEVNANNDEINDGGDCFLDEMKIFCKKVKEVLGYTISVKAKRNEVSSVNFNEKDGNIEEGEKEDENN